MKVMIKKYLLNIAISFDQLFNTVLGDDPDEVYSSRLGKLKLKHGGTIPWRKPLSKIICIDAIELDEGKDAILEKGEM